MLSGVFSAIYRPVSDGASCGGGKEASFFLLLHCNNRNRTLRIQLVLTIFAFVYFHASIDYCYLFGWIYLS